VRQMVQTTADEYNIRIETDLDPAVGTVCMDPHILHQCLSNLISNALDACLFEVESDKQWRVTIRTHRMENDRICFEVIDNGSGMSPEVQKKLFSRFFSTKGHRGTGLGLLVTRKLVKEHHGTITVQSKPGAGTTFTFCLPFMRHCTAAAGSST